MVKRIKTPKSLYRWSGGKSRAQLIISEFIDIPHQDFREIFLGGASTFLYKDKVEKNWLNDLDPIIYDGFLAIQQYPDELIELMKKYTPPTLEKYHEVKNKEDGDIIWKGFRGIYLNRTSFNGMVKCGPIGGANQTGKWLTDACWKNPDNLIQRVRDNHEKLKNVKITQLDFEEVIKEAGENVLMFIDPPYIDRNNLYNVGMNTEEHELLRNLLHETPHDFLLTYNDCPEIRELYKDKDKFVILEKSWTYSMMSQSKEGCRKGEELFIMNHELHNKYLEKKEQEEKEQLKIKKVILIRTINDKDGIYKDSVIKVEKELKHYYKGTQISSTYILTSMLSSYKVKIKKKNCIIIEYEQNGETINLEENIDNNKKGLEELNFGGYIENDPLVTCKEIKIIKNTIETDNTELKEKIICEDCDYLAKYVDKEYWPNKCDKCGKIYYVNVGENNLINNNNKNQKIMETNDVELKDYEIKKDMSLEEIEQEKYVKKINQEIDDILLKENE